MKRLLYGITALLLLTTTTYSLEGRSAVVKLGVVDGRIDTDTSLGSEDLDANLSVGLEYYLRYENGMDLGIGAAYERHELSSAKFNFGFNEIDAYPVYGLLRYRFNVRGNWIPYIYGNLGYAFVSESRGGLSVDDGMYYGAGLGVEYIESFGIEAGWTRTEFDADFEGDSFDPKSDLFKVSLTMRLDH